MVETGKEGSLSSIGRLKKVPLRELWPHEANRFTIWLTDNLDVLSDQVGFVLRGAEREVTVGSFFLDVLAEDESGHKVVIENQLNATDHDHLGKLLTYISNLDARTAFWITADPRPEHTQAVTWLNEVTPSDVKVFLVRLEAYRIEDSPAAPLFTVVAGPVQDRKKTVRDERELAERHRLRLAFWEQLLQKAKTRTKLHERISPGPDNWISASAGKSGLAFTYLIRMNDAIVELTIDRGSGREEETKQIFDALMAQKDQIEADFGADLEWDRGENRRTARIRYTIKDGGLRDTERWKEIQNLLIDAMIRLEKAMRSHLRALFRELN